MRKSNGLGAKTCVGHPAQIIVLKDFPLPRTILISLPAPPSSTVVFPQIRRRQTTTAPPLPRTLVSSTSSLLDRRGVAIHPHGFLLLNFEGGYRGCGTIRRGSMSSNKIELDHKDMIHDSAIDYYGKRLATASSDCTVKVVSIGGASAPSQLLATLSGHYGPVWRVAWAHPKYGTLLASCSYDGRVIIWKEGVGGHWSQAHVFTDHKSSVNSIAWAPYEVGLCLACGSSDGSISIMTVRADGGWDTATIERAHPVGVTAISWAPATALGSLTGSGELVYKLVSGGFDAVVKVWGFVSGGWKLESTLPSGMHTDCVRDVAWAPVLGLAKSTIASASQDGKVVIWTRGKDGDKWEGNVVHDFKSPVWRVSWSLTGNILSVAAGESNITLWNESSDGQWEEAMKVLETREAKEVEQ